MLLSSKMVSLSCVLDGAKISRQCFLLLPTQQSGERVHKCKLISNRDNVFHNLTKVFFFFS